MMRPALHEITISPCETHHIFNGIPLYASRFQNVLKFHPPGLAPVKDGTSAFHITLEGSPAYKERYQQTFGFYCSYAAVESDIGWHHISIEGLPLYKDRHTWCGNYQENLCAVRDQKGNYFHIDIEGKRLYPQSYRYVGDFKDGIAVVCCEDGKSSHISRQGQLIHPKTYQQLDVFHKGFARAKDEGGWFHITKTGAPAYSHRFLDIEPFYNGQAYAQTHESALVIIDERGNVIREIFPSQENLAGDLSSDLIGFWKSETIRLAIKLGVLDTLPATTVEITKKCRMVLSHVKRIMRALDEIGIATYSNEEWVLTAKGRLLVPTNTSFMAAASSMWFKVQNAWAYLEEKLMDEKDHHHPTFKEEATDERELKIYRRAIEGYATQDFESVSEWPIWDRYSSIISFGQTGITLLPEILKKHPSIHGILAHEDRSLYHFDMNPDLENRMTQVFIEYDKAWPLRAEAVIMPRFLHYFPDKDVLSLLKKTAEILAPPGDLYLFEMVLDPHNSAGGLLDLNMLAESGGRLRTFTEWEFLLSETGFTITKFRVITPYLHLIQGCKT